MCVCVFVLIGPILILWFLCLKPIPALLQSPAPCRPWPRCSSSPPGAVRRCRSSRCAARRPNRGGVERSFFTADSPCLGLTMNVYLYHSFLSKKKIQAPSPTSPTSPTPKLPNPNPPNHPKALFPQGLAAPLKLLSQLLQAQPLCAQLLQALLALLRQLRRGLQPRTDHGGANSPLLHGHTIRASWPCSMLS